MNINILLFFCLMENTNVINAIYHTIKIDYMLWLKDKDCLTELKTRKHIHKHLNVNGHGSLIRNNPKLETTQIFINWWMVKQADIDPHNGMRLKKKKEWDTDTYYNMDESQKHSDKWKKPNTSGYILYDPIFMTFQRRQLPG